MSNCKCKCMDPKKLKDKPENCTQEQIQTCHGKEDGHPCSCNKDETKESTDKSE